MKQKEILELISGLTDVLEKKSISEIEIEENGRRIRLVRGGKEKEIVHLPQQPTIAVQTTVPNVGVCKPGKDLPKEENDYGDGLVTSPMVGVAYLSPDPESNPFVFEGKSVKEGDTLLIIEAMKVMNPIKSEKSGVVKKIFVKNETPVEFGEHLMLIE